MGYNYPSNTSMGDEFFGTYGINGQYYPTTTMVCPMEQVKVAIDAQTHTIVVILERAGITPSPAISLRVGDAIALIQSLRIGINDIEMLPPSEHAMLT